MSESEAEYEDGGVPSPVPPYLEREHARLLKSLDRLEARIERVTQYGPDVFDDGEVLWFRKQFNPPYGATYTYAVVKAGGFWYTSGPKGGGEPRSWTDLVQFMSDGVEAVYWANGYEQVLP